MFKLNSAHVEWMIYGYVGDSFGMRQLCFKDVLVMSGSCLDECIIIDQNVGQHIQNIPEYVTDILTLVIIAGSNSVLNVSNIYVCKSRFRNLFIV